MVKPEPKISPFTEAVSGGNFSKIRGVTEHYFPIKYDNFECEIKFFNVEIKNFCQMEAKIKFSINGDSKIIETLYDDERWKFARTRYLLEQFPEERKNLATPAPLFCLMLNKYLQVIKVSGVCGGEKVSLIIDSSADIVILPVSYPPLTELPSDEQYIYYDKKSAVIYGDIKLNVDYEVTLLLEANAATFEFAPLFPFGKTTYQSIKFINSSEYGIEPMVVKVDPTVGNEFPEWFQYQLNKLTSIEPKMPHFRPAIPYRGTMPLFDLTEGLDSSSMTKKDFLRLFDEKIIDMDKPISLTGYQTIRFGFAITIPPDKNVEVLVRTIERPLPPRIYEQMQRLPNYRDALVEYDIFNLSHKKLRLRVETEILDYTEKETKTIFVHALNNKSNQRAREIITQCPRLKRRILEQLARPEKAVMRCKITDEDSKSILFEETYNVDLLAQDEIIWELNDLRSNQIYNLKDFICAWITPTDNEGLFDKVRSEARKFHPDNTLGHKLETLEDIYNHVKAIYDYLSEYGVNYLNQPFSAKISANSQRVVLPEVVLKNKAGNCIDLVVLFASILEGFGIYSLIFLTPNHAFIGWGNKNNSEELIILETTLIGRKTFEEAITKGKEEFRDNFLLNNSLNPIFMSDIIAYTKSCFIVDLQAVRYAGLISKRF
ncbi:MAG: hypothetical protein WC909_02850 [Candidatus Paceibacterota bacterium]|jgi:hypothetical protein